MVRWLKTSTCNAETWDQTSAQTTTGRWQQCVGSKPKTKLSLKLLPSNFNRCVHWFACGICFVDWLCQSGSRREQWAGKSGEPAGSTGFIINFILICRLIDWTWLQSSVQLTHNMFIFQCCTVHKPDMWNKVLTVTGAQWDGHQDGTVAFTAQEIVASNSVLVRPITDNTVSHSGVWLGL